MAYILSSQNVRIEQKPASIGARLGAFVIDYLIVFTIYYALGMISIASIFTNLDIEELLAIIFFLPLSYPLITEVFLSGQTIGKRALHIRVVTLEGGGPKITQLILRWMMLPFDIFFALGLGELCIFFTKRQQRLGDMVAGTWVVRTNTYDTENYHLTDYTQGDNYIVIYPKAKNLTPKQASLIAEVLYNASDMALSVAILELCRKVEKIVGPSIANRDAAYLNQVLNDYRYEEKR